MNPYREQGERTEEDDDMNYTTLTRWTALTIISLVVSSFSTCVAVNRHSDDAQVQKAHYDAMKAEAEAARAKGEADKAMWERMSPAKPVAEK